MSEKPPVISGKQLISFLCLLGYKIIPQRGSHVRLEKATGAGVHKITIPNHDTIAKGTLNDILTKVALRNQKTKVELIDMLRK